MASTMEYKGYIARVEYDDEAQLFHGQVMNLRDMITFQGRSVTELRKALRGSVDDYVASCAARGEEPEKPFSGKVLLRLTPEIHRAAMLAAAQRRRSLNAWASDVIERASRKGWRLSMKGLAVSGVHKRSEQSAAFGVRCSSAAFAFTHLLACPDTVNPVVRPSWGRIK